MINPSHGYITHTLDVSDCPYREQYREATTFPFPFLPFQSRHDKFLSWPRFWAKKYPIPVSVGWGVDATLVDLQGA